jgi:CheY-like chemotaxis protein
MKTAPRPPRNVLLAEDSLANQILARALLRMTGCEVSIAADGSEAVQAQSYRTFDLIFMDCHMPGMDGWEATRRIRRREHELSLKRVPIVALTADTSKAARDACVDAGMDGFMNKPYDRAQLTEVVTRWLPELS